MFTRTGWEKMSGEKQRSPKGLPHPRGCREMGGEKGEQEGDQGPNPAWRAGAFPTEGGGRFPQPSGDACRGAARGGRGWYGPSAWNPQPFAESGSSALESQRKQGLYGVMFLFLL